MVRTVRARSESGDWLFRVNKFVRATLRDAHKTGCPGEVRYMSYERVDLTDVDQKVKDRKPLRCTEKLIINPIGRKWYGRGTKSEGKAYTMEAELKMGTTVEFTYKNWRGETATRSAVVSRFFWGNNEYHPEAQMIMEAFDTDKQELRTFAVKDISNLKVIRQPEEVL